MTFPAVSAILDSVQESKRIVTVRQAKPDFMSRTYSAYKTWFFLCDTQDINRISTAVEAETECFYGY